MKLIDGPGGRLYISPYQTVLREHDRWRPVELARQMEEIYRNRVEQEGPSHPWILLERCVRHPFGNTPTVTQLAEASLRLEPTDEARIMAGLELIQKGGAEAAIRILRGVLGAPASTSVRASAQNNLGMAYSFLGQLHSAHQHYVEACNVGEVRLESWMNRLLQALQLGLVDDARIAAETVDAWAPEAVPAIEWFAESKEELIRIGNWSPSRESHEAIRKLESRLGPAARRIASAFGWPACTPTVSSESENSVPTGTGTGILPKHVSTKKFRLVS